MTAEDKTEAVAKLLREVARFSSAWSNNEEVRSAEAIEAIAREIREELRS